MTTTVSDTIRMLEQTIYELRQFDATLPIQTPIGNLEVEYEATRGKISEVQLNVTHPLSSAH